MESATSGETNLLLTCEDEEFDVIIQELSAGEILNTIGDLHQETGRIQQKVNVLQDQIKSLPTEEKKEGENGSKRYNSLLTDLNNSQAVLAKLINKSMKCFAQHKQRKLLEKEADLQPTSAPKTEVRISTPISKIDQSNDLGSTNHSDNKSENPVQDLFPKNSLMPITEDPEPKKGTVSPSNGISHDNEEKKTSPAVVKSARSSFEGGGGGGKPGGRKLIQEYSVKTPMDDIRAEIFKNVDKAAKENVSKLLVNNVAHLYNKDVKLRSKDDILAFKAEIESQVAMENNLKKGKVAVVKQNAHEEAAKNAAKVTGNMVEAKKEDPNQNAHEEAAKNTVKVLENMLKAKIDNANQNAPEAFKNTVIVTGNLIEDKNEDPNQTAHEEAAKNTVKVLENMLKAKIDDVNQNAPEASKNTVKVTGNLIEAKNDDINQNTLEENAKSSVKLTGNVVEAKNDNDPKTATKRSNKSLAPTVVDVNTSYEKKSPVGIAVTEVTISSSSTDRSPEPGSKDLNSSYFREISGSRVEQGERISSKNMQESMNMLEKFLQGGNSEAVSSAPPMRNFKIRSKGANSSSGPKNEIPVSKVERTSNSSTIPEEKEVEGEFQEKADTEDKMSDSMTKKNEDEGNKEPSSPKTPNSEKPEAAAAPVAPLRIPLLVEENDEPVKERVYLRSWDPTPLLKELYEIRLMDDNTEDLSHKFIEMEGLMEKLPMNKKKATLLKTWKRRYFRAKNGWLIYFDNRNDEKPSDEVLLMGGHVQAIGNHVIGIDDGRGRYLMVRCPSQKEYEQWLTALQSQTTDNTRATYIRPSMNALKHPSKKIVMIEFGSMSVRAGILKERATLPQLFFPNVVAISQENGQTKHVIGFDAYKPEVRHSSQLVQPFGPTDKVDKLKVDFETLPSIFTAIFQDLKIATAEYHVMLILPMNIIDEDKSTLMNILINQFKVCGVCMAPQALLALYSYNAQSGIMVDIGERLEVLPIYEGFVIDGGHTVQSFGAPKIRQSLRSCLASENYPLYSPLEQLLVRLVMEQTCYVSKNFNDDCKQYQHTPEKFRETLYLKKYNLPEETYNAISHSLSRFISPEGLFNTDLWGMDYPTIQSLVKNAIEACPMDNRRHLCRSIYLSGGVTLLPGFANRLEAELSKHLNETIVIQVHASSQRYHAAYIGACALCSMPEFEKSCITSEEWKSEGTKAFQKWKMTS